MFKKIFCSDKGAALPIVFVVMLVVIISVTAMLTISNTEQSIARNDYDSQKAMYIADAGFAYTMALIDKNPNLGVGGFVPQSIDLAGGKLTIENVVYVSPAKWQVTVLGKWKNISKELFAEINLADTNLEQLKTVQIAMPVGYAIYGGKDLEQDLSTIKITYDVPNYIQGFKNYTPVTYVYNDGDVKTRLESSTEDNVVYRYDNPNGTLKLNNSITYKNKKIVYVNGNLEIPNNTIISPQTLGSDFLMFVVDGNVDYYSNPGDKPSCVIVAKSINFQNNKAELDGILIANSITVNNGSSDFFDYIPSVASMDLSSFGKQYVLKKWKVIH